MLKVYKYMVGFMRLFCRIYNGGYSRVIANTYIINYKIHNIHKYISIILYTFAN